MKTKFLLFTFILGYSLFLPISAQEVKSSLINKKNWVYTGLGLATAGFGLYTLSKTAYGSQAFSWCVNGAIKFNSFLEQNCKIPKATPVNILIGGSCLIGYLTLIYKLAIQEQAVLPQSQPTQNNNTPTTTPNAQETTSSIGSTSNSNNNASSSTSLSPVVSPVVLQLNNNVPSINTTTNYPNTSSAIGSREQLLLSSTPKQDHDTLTGNSTTNDSNTSLPSNINPPLVAAPKTTILLKASMQLCPEVLNYSEKIDQGAKIIALEANNNGISSLLALQPNGLVTEVISDDNSLPSKDFLLAYKNGNVIYWNTATNNSQKQIIFKGAENTFCLDFNMLPVKAAYNSNCTQALAVADGIVRIFDCQAGNEIKRWSIDNNAILHAEFNHSDKYIVTITANNNDAIKIWDLNGTKVPAKNYGKADNLLATIRTEDDTEASICIVFSNTFYNELQSLCTENCKISIMNTEPAGSFFVNSSNFRHTNTIKKLEVSKCGKYLLTVCDEAVVLWNPNRLARKELCRFITTDKNFKISDATLSNDHNHLIIALENGIVYDYRISEIFTDSN